MSVLKLPYGPWKVLLNGAFEGYNVSVYQNPDKDVFSVVADKGPDGKVRGLVVMGYKAFKVDGPVESVLGVIERGIVVCKKKRDRGYKYLLIESDPKYIPPLKEELSSTVEKIFNTLNKEKILVQKKAKSADVLLTPIKFTSKKEVVALFSEPLFLMSALPGIKPPEEAKTLPLGKTRQGEVVKEPLTELCKLFITGVHARSRKKALVISIENFSISGIPVIVITDEPDKYTEMKKPSNGDLQEFGIPNIGFPVKVLRLGEGYWIDLNIIEPEEFADVLGISKGTPCYQVLSKILSEHRGELENIEALSGLVGGNRFSEVQLSRVLTSFSSVHGKCFGRNFSSEYLHSGEIGKIYVLEYGGKGDVLSKAGILCVLRGLGRYLTKRGGNKIHICIAFENAEKILGKGVLEGKMAGAMEGIVKTGKCAFVLETESQAKINDRALQLVETKFITASEDEIGVRIITKRPYRVKIRPFASGITL